MTDFKKIIVAVAFSRYTEKILIMGVKGKTDLEHIFVGSAAEKMFRRSPVTILSYRDGKSSERLGKRIHLK